MTVQINNTRNSIVTVEPHWTGTMTPYQMAYLSAAQKRDIGLPVAIEYAIRVDGRCAELVRVVNGYTAHKYTAVVLS